MMIVGVYATLGVLLLIASRNPDAHRSLIWFTIWSSVSCTRRSSGTCLSRLAERRGHLIADVPALCLHRDSSCGIDAADENRLEARGP